MAGVMFTPDTYGSGDEVTSLAVPRFCTLWANTVQSFADNVAAQVAFQTKTDPHGWGDLLRNIIVIPETGYYTVNLELIFGNNGAGYVQGNVYVDPLGGVANTYAIANAYRDASLWRTDVNLVTPPMLLESGWSVLAVGAQNTVGAISTVLYGNPTLGGTIPRLTVQRVEPVTATLPPDDV
jgi:hypothetical protein